jgi:hypothetical protein
MKKQKTFKALMLAVLVAFGMMATAQNDNFFRNQNDYENRDGEGTSITGNGITNQQFGHNAPLGSGLLILTAAGAGYAVARRRRSMRKAGTMLLALAMVLTLTQCKKRIENVTPSSNGGKFITLTIDENSKVDVNSNGVVTFEDGDFIIVCSNGGPVGALGYNNGVFSGILGEGSAIGDWPDPVEGQPLWFVFTGNTFPDPTDWTVGINDQYDNLAVLSTGASRELYSTSLTNYTSELQNKCALVKFTLTTETEAPVRINMIDRAKMTIDDETGEIGFEPTSHTGWVTLKNFGTNNERWAVVLPQSSSGNNTALIGNSVYNTANIPTVGPNDLNTTGTINNSYTPASTVDPYFSIGGGKIVHIASGNLQYQPSTSTWRFAEEQWHYVGGTENPGTTSEEVWGNVSGSSNNSIGESSYSGWIDLFGWGTGNTPTLHTTTDADYSDYKEWGTHVGDGNWYTLDEDQWDYLLNQNEKNTIRHGKNGPAIVHGVGGFVILPDWFECPSYTLTPDGTGAYNYHNHMDCYYKNNYTDAQWDVMEDNGAVFIPVAGSRTGTGYSMGTTDNTYIPGTDPVEYAGATTAYWSSEDESEVCAYGYNYKNAMYMDKVRFSQGCAVRLVHDVTLQ